MCRIFSSPIFIKVYTIPCDATGESTVCADFGLNKHVSLVDVWLLVTEWDLWHDNHLSQSFTCCVHLADSLGTSWHTLSFNFVGSHGNHRDINRGNMSYSSVNPLCCAAWIEKAISAELFVMDQGCHATHNRATHHARCRTSTWRGRGVGVGAVACRGKQLWCGVQHAEHQSGCL